MGETRANGIQPICDIFVGGQNLKPNIAIVILTHIDVEFILRIGAITNETFNHRLEHIANGIRGNFKAIGDELYPNVPMPPIRLVIYDGVSIAMS